eukprot:Hpha_TRINITY_DN2761_c0_g1::TRINITY_DN2761_c0_g1_i1::g.110509::m.110509
MASDAIGGGAMLRAASPLSLSQLMQLRHWVRQSPGGAAGLNASEASERENQVPSGMDDSSTLDVTLGDALGKIRQLKGEVERSKHDHVAEIDELRDELAREKERHLVALRQGLARWQRREQELIDVTTHERQSAIREAAAAAEAEVTPLREALALAETQRESLQQSVAGMQAAVSHRAVEDERIRLELDHLRCTVERDAEEIRALRAALERQRVQLTSERSEWETAQAQSADALAGYRRQAARAQLNARWVTTVQQTLSARDQTARAATAAAELCGELLSTLREQWGAAAADAAIHGALRSGPEQRGCAHAVAKAQAAGVDVGAMLSGLLRGLDAVRAAANAKMASASARASGHASTGMPGWLAAAVTQKAEEGAGTEAINGSVLCTAPDDISVVPDEDLAAAAGAARHQATARAARTNGLPQNAEEQQLAQQIATHRRLLQRAMSLQTEARDLGRPRQAESPRWSPPAGVQCTSPPRTERTVTAEPP